MDFDKLVNWCKFLFYGLIGAIPVFFNWFWFPQRAYKTSGAVTYILESNGGREDTVVVTVKTAVQKTAERDNPNIRSVKAAVDSITWNTASYHLDLIDLVELGYTNYLEYLYYQKNVGHSLFGGTAICLVFDSYLKALLFYISVKIQGHANNILSRKDFHGLDYAFENDNLFLGWY